MMTEDIRLALDRVLSEEILAEEYVDKKTVVPKQMAEKCTNTCLPSSSSLPIQDGETTFNAINNSPGFFVHQCRKQA